VGVEVVVASGKGGTGKTFISSNLSYFLRERGVGVVSVDADVEAPDLLLALGGVEEILWREKFKGQTVEIDYDTCVKCGACIGVCRFNALKMGDRGPIVDYALCEGFGTCMLVCPTASISSKSVKRGELYAARSKSGVLVVTGDLDVGEKNSGLLVYNLKSRAREYNAEVLVVDAAPGIGCPVISSLAGANLLVVVVEPSPQSVKGASRLLELAEKLKIESLAVLNKYDLNLGFAEKIEKNLGCEVIGRVGYDEKVVESYTSMVPLLKMYPEAQISKNLVEIFEKIEDRLKT